MTATERSSRHVRPDEAADPVAAVLGAHRDGRLLELCTSGTSGAPRAIVRSTASWFDSFGAYSALTGVQSSARLWVPGPFDSTMNLFAAVHAAWAGATVVDDPAEATHACLTPATLARRGDELARGASVVAAGAALAASAHARAEAIGLHVVSYYGAAELSFVAAGPHADALRAFPGVEIDVRDGVVWVRSPYLSHGVGPWASVGDLGRLDGDRLVVFGRPDTVTTAGATIALSPVEAVLRRVARGEVAVAGVPHASVGTVLAAAVTDSTDVDRLRAVARTELTAAQRPRVWRTVDALPLTAAGKLDRDALTALLADGR